MLIFVKPMTGSLMQLSVEPNDLVDALMDKVAKKRGIKNIEDFYFIYSGKILRKGNQLKDYGIKDDCTISLSLRVNGGF